MTSRQPRALALAALREWRKSNRFADAIIHRLLENSTLAFADRAFTTELVYGILRNLTLLDLWIGMLRRGKLDHSSRDILRLGLYQLFVLNAAEHAAVYETVALADQPARGLVNAVLRSAQSRRDELIGACLRAPIATQFSHPSFLVERWVKQFGEANATDLCQWNNQPPPMYGRVNHLRISTARFLADHGGAEPLAAFPNMVRLRDFPADALAGGLGYIQDPSTTVACELLDPRPGETVLDACAAPGGKTSYLAELMGNSGRIVATDRDRLRVEKLRENLERLGVGNAEVQQCNWTDGPTPPISAAGPFDRILIDVPCSNTGVMRRRVDVRWRLSSADFGRMQREQLSILKQVVPLLKLDGVLVYSTCSLEPEENGDVVAALRQEFPSLQLEKQTAVLPFQDALDGAFAAKLVRTA